MIRWFFPRKINCISNLDTLLLQGCARVFVNKTRCRQRCHVSDVTRVAVVRSKCVDVGECVQVDVSDVVCDVIVVVAAHAVRPSEHGVSGVHEH